MDYQEFLLWLQHERNMTIRSAKDVVCRLKRVANMLEVEFIDGTSIDALNKVEAFKECTIYIRSQLRRSIALYLEYKK